MTKDKIETFEKQLEQETKELNQLFQKYAGFYKMSEGVEWKDITKEVLSSKLVNDNQKKAIQETGRRIWVFNYPSDGLKIKALISFVPDLQNNPLLILLRGGNREFGILKPGCDLLCMERYTVLTTLYRGGLSEGLDEFGVNDVNDVKNLINFIPDLEDKLNLNLNQKMFLLGCSRGGLQMFLTLARFPELQQRFAKAVSLSGILDLRQLIKARADMKQMFIKDFGLIDGDNDLEWINKRNPLCIADDISPSLPILIIQGTCDQRVGLEQGERMYRKLRSLKKNATYWKIEGGKHCLNNMNNRSKLILDWLGEH